jgi:preprotein translocase subunit SecY
MIEALQRAWEIPELRRRIRFLMLMFLIYAFGAFIPIPGIDLRNAANGFAGNGAASNVFNLINIFTGGSLRRGSVFAMGITPYINASILFQMLTVAFPALDALQKEGEAGRKQIARYTRWTTIVLSILQAFGVIVLFKSFGINIGLFSPESFLAITAMVAGSMFLLWLGEQVTEKGVGNGVSLVIFAGILLNLPQQVSNMVQEIESGTASWFNLLLLLALFYLTVLGVVYLVQGTRRIPIQHNKRVIGMRQIQAGGGAYLPIKVNTAGVMPIIFAISLLLLPATLASSLKALLSHNTTGFLGLFYHFADWLTPIANKLSPGASWIAAVLYALLTIFFTYFYTAIVLNVEDMAENLKKYGSYIPGIRPGKPTFEYLDGVVSRITLAGAVFLAVIALLPYLVPIITHFYSFSLIGGTSLLIVVGVAIETLQAIEAQLLLRNYEGFIKSSAK